MTINAGGVSPLIHDLTCVRESHGTGPAARPDSMVG